MFELLLIFLAIVIGLFIYAIHGILKSHNADQRIEESRKTLFDSQREAMYESWRKKEDAKIAACKHNWSYAEPHHCLKCGVFKSKIQTNQ